MFAWYTTQHYPGLLHAVLYSLNTENAMAPIICVWKSVYTTVFFYFCGAPPSRTLNVIWSYFHLASILFNPLKVVCKLHCSSRINNSADSDHILLCPVIWNYSAFDQVIGLIGNTGYQYPLYALVPLVVILLMHFLFIATLIIRS